MQIYLTIILLAFSTCANAQIKESISEHYELGKKRPVLSFKTEYDKHGNIVKTEQKLLDSQGNYGTTIEVYTYDSKGHKKTLSYVQKTKLYPEIKINFNYRYTNQGYEEFNDTGKRVCHVDSIGNILKEEYYNRDGNIVSQKQSAFDNMGRLIKKEHKSFSDFQYSLLVHSYGENTRTEHYEYTMTDSVRTIEDFMADLNSKSKPIKRMSLTDGTIEILTYDHFDNEIDVMTFDKQGKVIRQKKTKYIYGKLQ